MGEYFLFLISTFDPLTKLCMEMEMVSVTVINGCVNLSDLTDETSWFTNL